MTIELMQVIVFGLFLIASVAYRDWRKAKDAYIIKRKGRNWVVRDNRGRFVRITSNLFDILSLGRDL